MSNPYEPKELDSQNKKNSPNQEGTQNEEDTQRLVEMENEKKESEIEHKQLEVEKQPEVSEEPELKGWGVWRIVIAFWILGLCNNYIYVIMLSAAHDVVHRVEQEEQGHFVYNDTPEIEIGGRNCTKLTVGAVLLADILPTLAVKLVCSFLPFFVHFRIILSVATGIISLVLVATSHTMLMAIVGVCFASFNSGLGEITFLAYSTNFVLHAIAGFSSGTGGAGLAGSFAYAGMTESGLTPETSLLISIAIPILMAVAFWAILKHPKGYRHVCANIPKTETNETEITTNKIGKGLKEKLSFMPKLLPFMIPVGLVYYFEYLINSGLFDKFEFHNTSLSKKSQFRWFNVMYQIGVFISRSSVTWVHFKKIWIMSLLQIRVSIRSTKLLTNIKRLFYTLMSVWAINFVVLFLESIYGFIPNVWIMFVVILWEGLLGGAAYVNTFYNMSYMIDKEHRLFALSIASVADTFGIVLSGVTTFPLHKIICQLPFTPVFRWP